MIAMNRCRRSIGAIVLVIRFVEFGEGYHLHISFVCLRTPEMAVRSVRDRVVTPLDLPEGERVELTLVALSVAKEKRLSKRERDAKDLEIINRNADRLNEEASVLTHYIGALPPEKILE